ncbi:MAG: exosortase/archaeosortase family protein [Verrucomicrobiae bacterium]|nr:exosortase/archaeosortase family protein [Verrucomicrobiae bacterium]
MNAAVNSWAGPVAGWGVLVLLWITSAWRLGPLWSSRPEYAFGWAAPVVCGVLFWERWRRRPAPEPPGTKAWGWVALVLGLAGLVAGKVTLEVAPILRPAAWVLAGGMVAATLGVAWLAGGRLWVRHFAFPVWLLLVFLPWPTRLEQWVMSHLVQFNVAAVIHALGVLGIPALARGSVMEMETGLVGVDEACSGIRSLQATLVAALVLGELRRLPGWRRLQLLGGGLGVAVCTNFLRTLGLGWLAAREGAGLVEAWHDPAGYGVLGVNFLVLMALAHRLARGVAPEDTEPGSSRSGGFAVPGLALGVIGGVVCLSEIFIYGWFARAETGRAAVTWQMQWPTNAAGFRHVPLSPAAQQMLGYDEGTMAAWMTTEGMRVQAAYMRWKPSTWRPTMARASMAQGHSPTVCLPAVGMVLLREGPEVTLRAGGQGWPCQSYVFDDRGRSVYVYVCLWRDRQDGVNYQVDKRAMVREVLRAIRRGARPLNTEQRLIMASVHGARAEGEARQALAAEWERWLKP